ncbi:uncharacterized protein LAJ45_06624 [Morchella importuna]|uniref:uncharacterized protein n=1 Tax=Morchella importuna TaxID=1174673 RepID=UPI001E8E6483|nr:uncharacterized protein LAJ45_06624 [Morchella importuna]KAH8149085.1 hypothetical protein LAJ45_06624 [Morchella importuna]
MNKRKTKPKADPLFKPEITKLNREIVTKTNKELSVTPSDIRAKINTKIQDPDFQLIAAWKTTKNNIILESKFVTPATKVLEYKKEIETALNELKVPFVDIRVNPRWSKFILHGIPTSIGEAFDAGQPLASEIRHNYGNTFELTQIPRWLSKPETRIGKSHSSMIIALTGQFTKENLRLRYLTLKGRR